MNWIEVAERQGRINAEEEERARQIAEANLAAFQAEDPVTVKKAVKFLESHKAPVIKLMEDLERAGYTVEESGPDYLYDSELPGQHDKDLGKYSLARIRSTRGGSEGYSTYHYRDVFGVQWDVSRGGNELSGYIRMYPMVNERTHLASVDYLEFDGDSGKSKIITTSTETEDVKIERLQVTIMSWIQKAATQPASA